MREIKQGKRVDPPRREEIVASGATLLVTACPECRMMLDAAVERTQDIAEVLAASLARVVPHAPTAPGGRGIGEGGSMDKPIADDPGLEAEILQVFEQHPEEESDPEILQQLNP